MAYLALALPTWPTTITISCCKMAAAPNNIIKLQRVESETTVQFQIDDLQSCFARPSPTKYSEHFGPGLRFGLYTFSNTGEPSYIGLYLYTSKEHPSMSITWTVHAKSLLGQAYLSKTMSYTFKSGEAIGWSKYLTSEQFHAMQPMKSENAIVLHATLRFTPVWPIVSKPTLDALHRVVVGKGTPDVRYVAYKKRTSNGRLTAPCTLCSSKEAMAQRSEELKDRESTLKWRTFLEIELSKMQCARPDPTNCQPAY